MTFGKSSTRCRAAGWGEEEAQNCEMIVQQAGVEWTILRASWFIPDIA